MKYPMEISNDIIVRDFDGEGQLGIQDIKLYAYASNDQNFSIVGEIIADSISENFSFDFTAYDKDGDIIARENNDSYSGGAGLVSYVINKECFFNRYPFNVNIFLPEGAVVAKVRILLNIEEGD